MFILIKILTFFKFQKIYYPIFDLNFIYIIEIYNLTKSVKKLSISAKTSLDTPNIHTAFLMKNIFNIELYNICNGIIK